MSDPVLLSRLTSKCQTVVPHAVRRRLGLKPGDRIRYHMRGEQVVIERVALDDEGPGDNPFLAFDEWSSAADDAAYRDL